MPIVKDSDCDHSARIINFPTDLFVPFRMQGVEECPNSNPFVPVLRHAVRIGRPSSLHRQQIPSTQYPKLKYPNPGLLKCFELGWRLLLKCVDSSRT
ncbi:hypothetical protein LINGRAHAP2_LOCUS36304 [Linum grandiflorum]